MQTAIRTDESARAAWRRRRSQLCRTVLAPPSKLTLSEWADRYRFLSRENSAEPGRFRTARVPYLKGVMDACTDRRIREVVVMKAAQVGFTDGVLNNLVGYHIDQDPAPMLVVQITVDEAEKWSKEKLAPMLRDTPRLRGKVKDARSRDSDNTILAKAYPGGHLGIVGANAPSGLRARPRRILAFDEIDGYPTSSGTEGDPIKLGEKRATTFWNRKILKGSTPTIKGFSKIEREYDRSTQERWYCPCPHCQHEQSLKWTSVHWDKTVIDVDTTIHHPETAAYLCEECAALIDESGRRQMIARGRWVSENPGPDRPTGFHIPGLISPFVTMEELAREFRESVDSGLHELLQVFVNTRLGETWEERGEQVDEKSLMARREEYKATVPMGVGVLTMATDVQGDRLEVAVKGWGDKEESWLIHREVLLGDPGDMDTPGNVWERLDEILDRPWQHEAGAMVRISGAAIDYGGHYADMVARYVKRHEGRNVFAIRGASEGGKPIWPAKPARVGRHGVKVYELGTDTAKDIILGSRIRRATHGQGYMHYPLGQSWCNAEYFAQLTSEKKVFRIEKGRRVRRWVPTRDRNEALDLEVYAFAVMNAFGATAIETLGKRATALAEQGEQERNARANPPSGEQGKPEPRRPRRSSWVEGWRK